LDTGAKKLQDWRERFAAPQVDVAKIPTATERGSTMDHTTHIRLEPAELNAANLEGADVYDSRDHKVGTISHLHGTGAQTHVVVDVGGFLGIGAKPVSLQLSQLDVMRDDHDSVHAITPMTKDQIEALPEHHH
jgi:hypothetical protein